MSNRLENMAFQIKNTFACSENWDKMNPTEKGRFCLSCSKEVHDFTKLSKEEIINVFKKNNFQSVCARAFSSQLSTIYLDDSIETISYNLPFWQKFLLVMLVSFGPEFLNINLVFAQDSTHVQTEEISIDSLNVITESIQDSMQNDSLQVKVKESLKIKYHPFLTERILTGSVQTLGFFMPKNIDFSIPFEQVLTQRISTETINTDKVEDLGQTTILKNLFPIRFPKKKDIPQKLLFVPLVSALRPRKKGS